jgi:hypothetical protein
MNCRTIAASLFILACIVMSPVADAQTSRSKGKSVNNSFSNWPKGSSPQEIGKKVADRFITTHIPISEDLIRLHGSHIQRSAPGMEPDICKVTSDKQLADQLVQRFEPIFGEEKN